MWEHSYRQYEIKQKKGGVFRIFISDLLIVEFDDLRECEYLFQKQFVYRHVDMGKECKERRS